MKIVLLILGGAAMSLVAFAGGIFTTILFLAAEPRQEHSLNVDASGLWTTGPVRVSGQTAEVERAPARPSPSTGVVAPAQATVASGQTEQAAGGVDAVVTAAISSDAKEGPTRGADAAAVAHVAWCSQRYRSYRADDNSYRPYRGGRQPCISPYIAEVSGAESGEWDPLESTCRHASLSIL